MSNHGPRHRSLFAAPDMIGTLLGIGCIVLSITPSLLPRPTLFQGLVSGACFAIGYGVGVLISVLLRPITSSLTTRLRGMWAWLIVIGCVVLATGILAPFALRWQNEVRSLVDMEPLPGTDLALFGAVTLTVSALLLLCSRIVRRLSGATARVLQRVSRGRIGPKLAGILTTIPVPFAVIALFTVGAVIGVDRIYAERNLSSPEVSDSAAVDSRYRSAGTGSLVDWHRLGRHGQNFIAKGPNADHISAVIGSEALEPVRVYVGMRQDDSLERRVELAVSELERTGAFERSTLVVATTTGSGWLEPQAVDGLEYALAGDSAIVAVQYAYTPSWVSFLFDQDAPDDAARMLFEAVEQRWLALPEQARPQLVVYGLSLGAHGAQNAFDSIDDMVDRTQGAVLAGPPNGTEMWRDVTAMRDPGSPVWHPVLDEGRQVRWLSNPGDFERLPGDWESTRIVYLQHATDPITWLEPSLLWREPEWLSGVRAADVSPYMRWIPLVTGVQVVIDMLLGESVPAGHGHNFGDVGLEAWMNVLTAASLEPAQQDDVQLLLETYSRAEKDADY